MNGRQERGQLRPIDKQFAKFLVERFHADEATATAGAVASALLEKGHSCMFLEDHAGEMWGDGDGGTLTLASAEQLSKALELSGAVGKPGERKPLILDGDRLYIYKYFNFETQVAGRLRTMASVGEVQIPEPVAALARRLFNEQKDLSSSGGQLQVAGAFLPLFSKLSIITGGPGTGKTTVLAKLLALVCADAIARGEDFPVIRLAAPTGKAAQRLTTSLQQFLIPLPEATRGARPALDEKIVDHLSKLVPFTLHRLLGLRGDTPHPKYDRKNPIGADIVVVDEASMMDVVLFARLVDALPEHTRLVLLGDRYQLASVEAGCVMADVCEAFTPNRFSGEFASLVNSTIALPENRINASGNGGELSPVVELRHSYRFEGDKPIGVVSRAVNSGNVEVALAALRRIDSSEDFCLLADHPGDEALSKMILDGFSKLLKCQSPEEAIAHLEDFMVLTALNEGRFGREGINQRVYRTYGSIPPVRPIKITQNSPQHRLFNGDMGVIMRTVNEDGSVSERAWFGENKDAKGDGKHAKVRAFLVGALPAHVDAFAITIHNSQGSEFDRVAIVLPELDVPLLTRELLYTAITRGRRNVTVFGEEEVLRFAIGRRTERHSGLEGRLS
jgi:exodeoxyribonuclease V alpha subunit